MATTAITAIYPYCEVELPRCPEPLLLQTAIMRMRDFCKETQAWTSDLDAINVEADVQEYELNGDQLSYADIIGIISVYQDDSLLDPNTDYSISDRENYTLYLESAPSADSVGGLEIQVALAPKLTSTLIETRFFEDWVQYFAYGTMAKLMAMPGKAWTNPQLSVFYERKYYDGIVQAKIQQSKGGLNVSLSANAPKNRRWA